MSSSVWNWHIQDKFTIFFIWFIFNLLYILQRLPRDQVKPSEGNQEEFDDRDE